ncbi:MAG: saccharopine dehydrogenase NADP-binding domain-containing protein [Cyanobacteria bacterium J06636_16]
MAYDDSQYDLVIFGATGFVGQIVCRYLLEHTDIERDLRWAIAGRSRSKLEQLVSDLRPNAANLPLLIADAADESTLQALCTQTRVVISTVGPYALYGEPLVRTCVKTGTDYCDLTGEVQWIHRMVQTYEALAQQSGARIIHCCGFDSIPSDLGVYYLQQQAQKQLGESCVQVKMRVQNAQGGVSGGTIASGLNLFKEATDDTTVREALENPYILCPAGNNTPPHPPALIPVQYDEDFQAWVTPFIMAGVNTPVVLRSHAFLKDVYGESFQYDEAIPTGSGILGWTAAQSLNAGLGGFALAASVPPIRSLLEQWVLPASGEGPSLEAQEQGFYDLRFWGKTASGKTIQVKVTGDRDPGYGSTSKILGQAGICLAKDFPKLAKSGGFWTPAAMFGDRLIQRLVNYSGLAFEVL